MSMASAPFEAGYSLWWENLSTGQSRGSGAAGGWVVGPEGQSGTWGETVVVYAYLGTYNVGDGNISMGGSVSVGWVGDVGASDAMYTSGVTVGILCGVIHIH